MIVANVVHRNSTSISDAVDHILATVRPNTCGIFVVEYVREYGKALLVESAADVYDRTRR